MKTLKILAIAAMSIAMLARAKAAENPLLEGMATMIIYGTQCEPGSVSADTYATIQGVLKFFPVSERLAANRKTYGEFQSLGRAAWCADVKPSSDKFLGDLNELTSLQRRFP
jgi:hypothetical protein